MPLEKVLALAPDAFDACRLLLCVGDDEAWVQDAARDLVRKALGAGRDPFRLLDTDASQRDLALTHLFAPALGGGDPVLRLRGASDRHAKLLAEAAALRGPHLIVAEAVGLAGRSTALTLVEGLPHAHVVSCGRDGETVVRACLLAAGRTAEPTAFKLAGGFAAAPGWGQLPAQLALLAEAGVALSSDSVMACAGQEGSTADVDALWVAALSGKPDAAIMVHAVLESGTSPISVLRAGLMAVHRMRALTPASGISVWVPRLLEGPLRSAARLWPDGAEIGAALNRAEQGCKSGRLEPALVVIDTVHWMIERIGIRNGPSQAGMRSRTKPSS